ncbi:hypothetical protein H2200_005286 [Cladophialophora chaetospira]|uniref:Uncharacterized protein n=1 Tax=Cladophialophora chaetospira TaxID=386627 RepID=A0AA38XBS9_9EURO|nr:hypothetical protein H2200_005286 [Cladophialophora chaetospira]
MSAQVDDDNSDSDSLYDEVGDEADNLSDTNSESSSTSDSSFSIDPQTLTLEDLTANLNALTLQAETILSHQPRGTQLVLAKETKVLFKQYEKYGSMARLKVGIEKFLRQGDEKGRLRIEGHQTSEDDLKSMTARSKQTNRPAHYGAAFMLNNTSDDDVPKFNADTDFITLPVRDPFEPNLNNFIHHPLRTIDPDSIPYVTSLPWDPIATQIKWPAHLAWPRGLLSAINKILSLVEHESRVRLFHHVSKWGPSPVFRAGIGQHVKALYSDIFETAEENYLGLTPETRSFLKDIYFKKQYLNVAERRTLALACRINEDSVAIFWEDMAAKLRGYEAMRIFMAAREIEKNREAKRKYDLEKNMREHKRREEVRKEHEARMVALRAGQAGPEALMYYQVDGGAAADK